MLLSANCLLAPAGCSPAHSNEGGNRCSSTLQGYITTSYPDSSEGTPYALETEVVACRRSTRRVALIGLSLRSAQAQTMLLIMRFASKPSDARGLE